MHLPHIVVLGAGYGGLMVVRELMGLLEENEAKVTLVDQNPYHTLTTNLHEAAAGTADPELTCVPLKEFLTHPTDRLCWQQGRVVKIDTQGKKVFLADLEEPISYDYLVIGMGSVSETFGIPGLQENAFFIRDLEGSCLLRDHMEERFSGYKDDPRPARVTMVVGGAGFTGMEYLGELVDRIPELCCIYGVPQAAVRIINVEAAPGALPGFDEALVDHAVRYLSKKGITFRFRTAIASCSPTGVTFRDGGEVTADTVVWTGGVRGLSLLSDAGLEVERSRVPVDDCLQTKDHKDLFVIGDCSLVGVPSKEAVFYPPTAQLAMQQGSNVGYNLVALLRGQAMVPFCYEHKGTIASLGRYEAIGMICKVKLRGKLATLLKRIAHYRWLYLAGGTRVAWRYGLQADMRGRKLVGEPGPTQVAKGQNGVEGDK
ncbi:NAD(P)/FAD-dependent oxidoreductase [Pasteuria penetrans]|uniref:NAD(P)/FAD-dependent oxidoreductase n=1 Tax=Pasteuria penetrans TaxID=86005 RepID=UPI000F9DD463|nr:NAD(P)/FAD-dependent oxidoreductase [Pasteuria penetrans]